MVRWPKGGETIKRAVDLGVAQGILIDLIFSTPPGTRGLRSKKSTMERPSRSLVLLVGGGFPWPNHFRFSDHDFRSLRFELSLGTH